MVLVRTPIAARVFLSLCVAVLPGLTAATIGQDAPPSHESISSQLPPDINITMNRVSVDPEGNYEFIGNVTVLWRDSRIQADRVTVRERRYLTAEGSVLIVWGGNHVYGTHLEYDLETERGVIEEGVGQVRVDYLFRAKRVEKIGDDLIHLESAVVTTCTQPTPYWSFAVSSATIRIEGYARMWNVRLKTGPVPVLYLPYLIWPVKQDRAAGLLMPEFHTTNTRGRAMSQQLFIPIGRSADLTLLGRYYTEAGFGGGGQLRFIPNAKGAASLGGFYLRDKVDGRSRYRASYDQTQQFRNGFRMVADVDWVSDFDYYTDFERELDLVSSPTILARLEFSRNGPWTSLNVRELRREQLFSDESSLVQQTLPEIEWRGRSRRLGKTPFYLEYSSSLASIQQRRKTASGGTKSSADYLRADIFPTVSIPLSPFPWLDVTPQVSYRWTHYTQSQRALEDSTDTAFADEGITRTQWNAGLEIVGPKLFRIYERPNSAYSPRYKHSIETRLTYANGQSFDRTGDIIRFDEIDNVSGVGESLSYAVVQRLFAKRPRRAPTPSPSAGETIVLPDGSTSEAGGAAAETAGAPEKQPSTPKSKKNLESVEIASFEIRQTRSFDRELSLADLDRDGEIDTTSPYSDVVLIGRLNPSPSTSVDIRGNYDVLYDAFQGVTLSGGVQRQLARMRFSVVHSNGLAVGAEDDTQLRLATGFNFLQGRFRLDLEGTFDYDPAVGQTHLPEKRWQLQYSTQCCTFTFERLARSFSSPTDRRDFYFRVDLKGVGKLLDLNY